MSGGGAPEPGGGAPDPEETTTLSEYQKSWNHVWSLSADICNEYRDEYRVYLDQPWIDWSLGSTVVLCSTNFRRGFQMKQVLPWNLMMVRRFPKAIMVVVLFGPDDPDTVDSLTWIQKELGFALRSGELIVGLAPMKYWSSPEAKNTAHVFAKQLLSNPVGHGLRVESHKGDPFLINLDIDNVMSVRFLESVFGYANLYRQNTSRTLIQYRGTDGGVTGRIGILPECLRGTERLRRKFAMRRVPRC